MEAATAPPAEATDFVRRFEEAWDRPTADLLGELVHRDAVLEQPMLRRMSGRPDVVRGFGALLAALPDLRADVVRWSAAEATVFIELRLQATVAWRPFEWTVVDRIVLDDGLVRERITYWDPLRFLLESLKRPSRWPAFVRLMR